MEDALIAPLRAVMNRKHVRRRIWRDTLECGHIIESTLCAKPAARRRCPCCSPVKPQQIPVPQKLYQSSAHGAENHRQAQKRYRDRSPHAQEYERSQERLARKRENERIRRQKNKLKKLSETA